MNFTSITDAVASVSDTTSFIGTVLEISNTETYKNKAGDERSYFTLKVADTDSFTRVRVYNKQLLKTITKGNTFAFMNMIKKTDTASPFWAIASTQVIAWTPLVVPQEVLDMAVQDKTTVANSPRKLADALTSQSTSTVQGKVVQSSPVKYVRDGNLAIKHLALKDNEAAPAVAVSLFGDEAERQYAVGEVISVTDVYRYKQTDSLSTKPSSKVEFHPTDVLPFDIKAADALNTVAFQPEADATVPFTIRGIKYAYVYQSCMKFSCKNKKLRDGKCPNCGSVDADLYCNLRAIVEHNNNFTEHSLFLPELTRLLTLPPLTTFNQENTLMDFVVRSLPIQGRGTFTGDRMGVAAVKRKRNEDSTE